MFRVFRERYLCFGGFVVDLVVLDTARGWVVPLFRDLQLLVTPRTPPRGAVARFHRFRRTSAVGEASYVERRRCRARARLLFQGVIGSFPPAIDRGFGQVADVRGSTE